MCSAKSKSIKSTFLPMSKYTKQHIISLSASRYRESDNGFQNFLLEEICNFQRNVLEFFKSLIGLIKIHSAV